MPVVIKAEVDLHHESSVGTIETHMQDLFSLDLILLEALGIQFGSHATVDTSQTGL
jgi:hypothetical protein